MVRRNGTFEGCATCVQHVRTTSLAYLLNVGTFLHKYFDMRSNRTKKLRRHEKRLPLLLNEKECPKFNGGIFTAFVSISEKELCTGCYKTSHH